MKTLKIKLRGAVPSQWKLFFQTGCGDVPYPAGLCLEFDDGSKHETNGGVLSIEEIRDVRNAFDKHLAILETVGIFDTESLQRFRKKLGVRGLFTQGALWLRYDKELVLRIPGREDKVFLSLRDAEAFLDTLPETCLS